MSYTYAWIGWGLAFIAGFFCGAAHTTRRHTQERQKKRPTLVV